MQGLIIKFSYEGGKTEVIHADVMQRVLNPEMLRELIDDLFEEHFADREKENILGFEVKLDPS